MEYSNRSNPISSIITRTLIGGNRSTSNRFIAIAASLLLGVISLTGVRYFLESVELLGPAAVLISGAFTAILLPAMVILAGVSAYHNDGLLISWTLVFVPIFGLLINGFGGFFSSPGPVEIAAIAIRNGVLYAPIIGTGSFLVGICLRRIVRWKQSGRQRPSTLTEQ